MCSHEAGPDVVEHETVLRISTTGSDPAPIEERVGIIPETPVTIDVEGIETYTVLCTPTDRRALAVGFLFTEGVIDSTEEITHLEECQDAENVIRVRLSGGVPRIGDSGRNLLIVSSCGACGDEGVEARIGNLPRVTDTLRIPAEVLRTTAEEVRANQRLFEACGGTHAAGIFDEEGEILSWAEDTGRHNALDKAIGLCLLAGTPTAGRGVVLSGRVSLEMAGKCARAGIELISAVSAPTSLAMEVTRRCDITLCAFVRKTRATVFTHPRRIEGLGS
jgi:FdhD protein